MLLAEGDSWFSFPGSNVLHELRYLGYSITSVAEPGDTMARMAENADELTTAYRRATRDHGAVHGVLLSGGGNEIMAGRVGDLLLPRGDESTLDDEKVDATITGIEKGYKKMIGHIEHLAGGSPPAVFLHGYEHPIPDGREIEDASLLLALVDVLPMIELPGPWMAHQFRCKGYDWPADRIAMIKAMAYLVDRFNDMLESLAAVHPFVHHVDLRQVFPPREEPQTLLARRTLPNAARIPHGHGRVRRANPARDRPELIGYDHDTGMIARFVQNAATGPESREQRGHEQGARSGLCGSGVLDTKAYSVPRRLIGERVRAGGGQRRSHASAPRL